MYARLSAARAHGPGERVFGYRLVTYPLVGYPRVTYPLVTYRPVTEQAFARIRDRLTRLEPAAAPSTTRLTRLEPPRHGTGETRLTRLEPARRMAAYWRGRLRGLAHNDPIWPP